MSGHTVSIPVDCTSEQFIVILDSIGFTHSQKDYIESDLTTIRGKTVKIYADKKNIVTSYKVPMPDPE